MVVSRALVFVLKHLVHPMTSVWYWQIVVKRGRRRLYQKLVTDLPRQNHGSPSNTRDTSDSDYEGVKESEETLQRANGKRAKVSAATEAVKKKEQKEKASMVAEASKKKRHIYDSSSDEDEGFDEMKRKLLAKRAAAASSTKDASSSDDEVQVVQKKAPVHSSTYDRKRKAPPPPSSSSSSEDEEEEFDYETYAREAAERRAKARES